MPVTVAPHIVPGPDEFADDPGILLEKLPGKEKIPTDIVLVQRRKDGFSAICLVGGGKGKIDVTHGRVGADNSPGMGNIASGSPGACF